MQGDHLAQDLTLTYRIRTQQRPVALRCMR